MAVAAVDVEEVAEEVEAGAAVVGAEDVAVGSRGQAKEFE